MTSQTSELVARLTRPIIGIENRSALEVFDIMCDRFRRALERLSSSEVTEEWLPIETPPKDGLIDVWVALQGGYRLAGAYYDSICGEWRTSRPAGQLVCIREHNVTHWRPLPEPPRSAATSKEQHP